eukprot:SAG31_NODE_236_length_19594_cov_7.018620_4_plen_116_part_00
MSIYKRCARRSATSIGVRVFACPVELAAYALDRSIQSVVTDPDCRCIVYIDTRGSLTRHAYRLTNPRRLDLALLSPPSIPHTNPLSIASPSGHRMADCGMRRVRIQVHFDCTIGS